MTQPSPLDINILPERYRPRQITGSTATVILALSALLFGLMPAYALLASERRETANLEARRNQIQAALDQVQVNQGQLEQVEEQIEQTRQQIDLLNAELESVGQQAPDRSQAIQAIADAMALGVQIENVSQERDVFTIKGEAKSQELVLDYARVLQSSGWFARARVISIVDSDPATSTVEFSIQAEQ